MNAISQEGTLEGESRNQRFTPGPLSVVVPAYNEHQTITQVVDRLLKLEVVGEVIVVDDGSAEATRQALTQLSTDGRVRVLHHHQNRGKGAALRSGFAASTGQVVAVQDADFEYRPEDLPSIIQPILSGEADVVYGSRELGSRYHGSPWLRKAANRSLTWLSNRMTGLNLSDMETGCKAFSREVVDTLTIEEDRFGVEPELTAKVAAMGCRVTEKPISYLPRSYQEGKKIGVRDGLRAVWCIALYSRRRSARRAPAYGELTGQDEQTPSHLRMNGFSVRQIFSIRIGRTRWR
ncbi:Undecaprenyl-phosphate mannosyltransferase [Botrimarina colliarenosi]|uniref:Undecaprenyl-phosphate mannosyltransferase n=1 Tax=Botrimarina colliarenosi TaxID=2528001 RepID=A0A5C6ALT5_9BACT|nr:glycosyltransferase family 2 protein [Botrimarina colliarenosi]TWU00438.1 Undecaprenyl-phosphate mannosyltransferase [Botrimarina colliarenosi]